jgi:hypothetical protein
MVDYDATGPQKRAITKLCIALGVKEFFHFPKVKVE